MIRFGEGPTAADRHETRVAVFREDHTQHPSTRNCPTGEEQGDELPPELQNAARRRQAIKEAIAELEKETQEQGKEEPLAKAQRNFTDSESRIMRSGEGAFIQGYNGQAAVGRQAPDHRRCRP